MRFIFSVTLATLLLSRPLPGDAGDMPWLVRSGKAQCVIVRGAEDDYAGERLQRWFAEVSGADVPVLLPEADLPETRCVILIGSVASNPLLARMAESLNLDDALKGLTSQGYAMRSVRHKGRHWLLVAGGGWHGAMYGVVDLINWRLKCENGNVLLPVIDTRQIPRFKYRWLWTWDHRMDWGGPGRVGTKMGGGGTFSKKPEAFLIDYKRCVDYMADHKFNGLVIWGFLRDTHGGVEASQELCKYARKRGVRILPGVGTSGYAGYYFEGDHPYNASTWLAEHPELRAIDAKGKPKNAPCPSKKANQEWLDEGARWLFDTLEIGGVNLEMGDFFVCHCADCKAARARIDSTEPDYYKDMAISHSVTLKTMRGLAPDAWLSYATYTGYKAEMMETPPRFLSIIPDYGLCQWTLSSMARRWPADVRPMARHNLGYLHWCNRSTKTEDDFYLNRIRDICRNAAAVGIEGLNSYGELSPERPNAELFYLAWEAFLWDPEMSIDAFVEERLARLYGGKEAARALLKIIPIVKTAKLRENPDALAPAGEIAKAARESASPDGRPRWERLAAYIERHEQASRDKLRERREAEAAARKGTRIPIESVRASDEDPAKGWAAKNAVDDNVQEPAGYWLTRSNHPKQARLELKLAEPCMIDRVVLFHQLNPRHYRSLDYSVSLRVEGEWKQVVAVKGNRKAGWVAHTFEAVLADAARLEITRSAYGNRMGVGEFELRCGE